MIFLNLIIGGSYSGKRDHAMKKYNLKHDDIKDCSKEIITDKTTAKCVCNYELQIKKLLEKNCDPKAFTNEFLKTNPNVVIIMNEIGNGIIPLERFERQWREEVGRTGCLLAEKALSVERVICGTAVKIKG